MTSRVIDDEVLLRNWASRPTFGYRDPDFDPLDFFLKPLGKVVDTATRRGENVTVDHAKWFLVRQGK